MKNLVTFQKFSHFFPTYFLPLRYNIDIKCNANFGFTIKFEPKKVWESKTFVTKTITVQFNAFWTPGLLNGDHSNRPPLSFDVLVFLSVRL